MPSIIAPPGICGQFTSELKSYRNSNVRRLALRSLILGPLAYDVELASKALVGLGTNETLLIELVLGRPGHEIRWLKTAYKQRYVKDLVDNVKSDLSGSTKRSQYSVSFYVKEYKPDV